jgi:hypothetical protein
MYGTHRSPCVPKYHIGSTSDHIGAIKIATVNLENKMGRERGGTHRNRCVRNSTKKGAHIGTLMWDLSFCSVVAGKLEEEAIQLIQDVFDRLSYRHSGRPKLTHSLHITHPHLPSLGKEGSLVCACSGCPVMSVSVKFRRPCFQQELQLPKLQ